VGSGTPRGGAEAGGAGGDKAGDTVMLGIGTDGTDMGIVGAGIGVGDGVLILAIASSSSFFSSTKMGPCCAAAMNSLAAAN
jgi:hypothetical protein